MLLLWFRLVYLFRLTNAKNFSNDISSSVFAFSACLVPLSAYLLWLAFLHFLNALWGEGDLIVLLPCCLPLFQISESSRSCSLVCKTIKITLHLRYCQQRSLFIRSHIKFSLKSFSLGTESWRPVQSYSVNAQVDLLWLGLWTQKQQ